MRTNRFLAVELGASHHALFLVAHFPARIAYGLAPIFGELQYQLEPARRKMILDCLELALGERLTPKGRIRAAHDLFRLEACKDADLVRLAGDGRALVKLVNIRGLEHLQHSLALGKGAVVGSAHFGSWESELGLLGALGFPVTPVLYFWPGRQVSVAQMLVKPGKLNRIILRKILHHHVRPSIDFDESSRSDVAPQAARVLAQNEIVFIMMDVVGFPSRHPHTVPFPFLNGLARMPTGAVRIAKSSGASLLMCFTHRAPDWRHQVIEISAPIPTEGDTDEINRHCVRMIENAIRREPDHWEQWDYKTMLKLGLISEEELQQTGMTKS